MKKAKISAVIVVLIFIIKLICISTSNTEEYMSLPKEHTSDIISESDLTSAGYTDDSDLNDWLGYYTYYKYYEPDINICIDIFIYEEDNRYYAYIECNGFQLLDRLTAEVQKEGNEIHMYFLESALPVNFKRGDLLFSLKNEGNEILTKWENMLPDEKSFCWENAVERGEHWISAYSEVPYENRENFLKENGAGNGNELYFSSYDNNGNLYVELYYDEKLCSGTGFCYFWYNNWDNETLYGFTFHGYRLKFWEDTKFSVSKDDGITCSDIVDYNESFEYNEDGQMTKFQSEGLITDWGESYHDTIVSVEFVYREDGTLEAKKCFYNPRVFGTYRSSETYYYDSSERLLSTISYVTHGSLEQWYIYDGDSIKPSYCFVLDTGWGDYLIKFINGWVHTNKAGI